MLTVEPVPMMGHIDLDLQAMHDRVDRMAESAAVKEDFHSLINEIVFLRTRHDLRGVALKLVIEQLAKV